MKFFSAFFFVLLVFIPVYAKNVYTIDKQTLKLAEKKYGKSAKHRMLELVKLLNKIDKESERKKLEYINDFFNTIKFAKDIVIYKKKDYWATREEFLDIALGDCEDYVIAKYFSLRQLGVSEKKIFLTYVKAIKYKQSHMVLTYYEKPGAIPLVLDNINPKILPSTQRRDLRPLFSFNGENIYMAKQRGLGREVPKGKVNLKQWSDLILKIKKEKQ